MKRVVGIIVAVFIICFAVRAFCAPAASPEPKQQQITPHKVSVDTNFDGKPDRTEYYNEKGQITKVESDPDEDGIVDETIMYENGKPVKGFKDTNKDGKPDVWIDF